MGKRAAEAMPVEDRHVRSQPHADEPATLLHTRTLRRLYELTLRARLLRSSQRGEAAAGEAVLAGIAVRLKSDDVVVTSSPNRILNELRPHREGPQPGPHPRNIAIADLPAAALGLATGLALAWRFQRGSNIALWLGESTRGYDEDWHEVMRTAGELSLPIVFVVDATRSRPRIAAEPFGFPTITVDAGDPIAVYRVAEEAIKRARRRLGATLMVCMPYPRHTTDGLALLEGYLRGSRHWSEQWAKELHARCKRELPRKR